MAQHEAPTSSGAPDVRTLSSVLTPVYKFAFSAALVAIGSIYTYQHLKWGPAALSILRGWLPWIFILWLTYLCVRLKRVVARPDGLVISNYIIETWVPYGDIQEVKGYRGRSVVFVRLGLRDACRFGRRIHFLLPSILARIDSQPEVQLLQERCPHLRERVRSRWSGSIYLRPPTVHG